MAENRATLTIRVGDKEIRFEADREAVEARLDRMTDRVLGDIPADVVSVDIDPADAEVTTTGGDAPREEAPAALPESERLAQLFAVGGKRVTLRRLPEQAVDALLLVLYGMWKLRGQKWVSAPGLTSFARASGARFKRADRLLAGRPKLYRSAGRQRSRRYRLTEAGRGHCERLVERLVGPTAFAAPGANVPPPAAEAAAAPVEDVQPSARLRRDWTGELLSAAQVAERLGDDVDPDGVAALRRDSVLLGLLSGSRKTRCFFYPAFQIDTENRRIYPEVRKVNMEWRASKNSLDAAFWWSDVEPGLGAKPMDLVGTAEAEAVVRAVEARFAP